MTVLLVLAISVVVLVGFGGWYSRRLARWVGEDPARTVPSVEKADGRDYVPTPTPVVFAHHFASIAGAGPIVGPVMAMVYGWVPALCWVLGGGVLIGAVHDYLATFMATREGGQSMAVIARRLLGKDAFIALMICLVVMLALVCATFLNLSAEALTSTVEMTRVKMDSPGLLRLASDGKSVIVGGIASMSVIIITAVAPLVGWMYIKKRVAVWKCSLLAVGICAVSIVIGLYFPIPLAEQDNVLGLGVTGGRFWIYLLSAYVLVAAGVPVWIFLQSRDFINVHILYAGLAALIVMLVAAGVTGGHLPDADATTPMQTQAGAVDMPNTVRPFSADLGRKVSGPVWPMLFILIACGAVSGFHSLCAGGTTCKQLTSEPAARRIGYWAMLLESFLAVCVIGVCIVGVEMAPYLHDVYKKFVLVPGKSNPVLAFAMAVGQTGHVGLGLPIVVGTIAGMVLLEGFLVTTLDTAVRLTRYLIEEIWRTFFADYDVFAAPVAAGEPRRWRQGEPTPVGAGGIPARPEDAQAPAPAFPTATMGLRRGLLKVLRMYWFNSGLAVALTLLFAFSGGAGALWPMFATSNQVLAAMVLSLATLWLLRQRRRAWFALLPAIGMLATTGASMVTMLRTFSTGPGRNYTLLAADAVLMAIVAYLFVAGIRAAVRQLRGGGIPTET